MNTSAGTGGGGVSSGYHHNKKTGGLDLWEVSKKKFSFGFLKYLESATSLST